MLLLYLNTLLWGSIILLVGIRQLSYIQKNILSWFFFHFAVSLVGIQQLSYIQKNNIFYCLVK